MCGSTCPSLKASCTPSSADGYDGRQRSRSRIDADTSRTPPTLALKLDGKALDLSAVLAASGVKRETRDGKVDIDVDVAVSGDSPRSWASTANGQVLAQVGKATLINTGSKADTELDRLAQAINPFREARASNELDCAVVRLPLRNGVATVDQSIALETHEVSVSASGTVDLRNETLDLSIKPRIKRGIPVDVAQFAELVHFGGPFHDPRLSIDRAGSVATVARIGAAIQTGGLSVLGESLLSRAGAGGDGGVCRVALQGSSGSKNAVTAAENLQRETNRRSRRSDAHSDAFDDGRPAYAARARLGYELGACLLAQRERRDRRP